MAPGKPYIHNMEASDLAALKDESPQIAIYWKARSTDSHDNFVFQKYPAKVLVAFSHYSEFENAKYATFVGWQKEGVVKVVLQWMLDCCDGNGLKHVKDVGIDPTGLVSANDDSEFGRYFKTAYLFDFAQEYKIKHLEDKLRRELEFQAKGRFPVKAEEIYDMANYFYQPNRDETAMNLMIDSIAKGYVKDTLKPKYKYDSELVIWKKDCNCHEKEFAACKHDDLAEKVKKRVTFFEDPENEAMLNEEFGKPKVVEDTVTLVSGNGWSTGNDWSSGEGFNQPEGDWGDSAKMIEGNKENQAPGDWAEDEVNEVVAAAGILGAPAAAGPTGGW